MSKERTMTKRTCRPTKAQLREEWELSRAKVQADCLTWVEYRRARLVVAFVFGLGLILALFIPAWPGLVVGGAMVLFATWLAWNLRKSKPVY
jgi:hypothetical protein